MILLPIKNTQETYQVNPTKIIALGLNYRAHVAENPSVNPRDPVTEIPTEPILFPKTPNALVGPGESIVIPRFLKDYQFESPRVDYEAELAFFVGKKCKNIKADQAFDYIFGFTCANDVSQRNIQHSDKSGWFRGKSLDTFCPVGPVIVRPADLNDPQNLAIECRLNGKVVQSGNTNEMIFSIPVLLAFIAKNFTLEAGDLILTGTPAGVGPVKHGDVVQVEIEGIGILENPVKEE